MRKAARSLRKMRNGTQLVDKVAEAEAMRVLQAYRRGHAPALNRAQMALRSMTRAAGVPDADVGQRLKKVPQILKKLDRYPSMDVTRMNDIAGCRCVVSTLDDVERMMQRFRVYAPVVDVYDYIATPKPDGYRGIHVIVEYGDGAVEVQLRTELMNDWSQFVEELDSMYGTSLKTGGGPVAVAAWLSAMSESIACDEYGVDPSHELLERYDRTHEAAIAALRGGVT